MKELPSPRSSFLLEVGVNPGENLYHQAKELIHYPCWYPRPMEELKKSVPSYLALSGQERRRTATRLETTKDIFPLLKSSVSEVSARIKDDQETLFNFIRFILLEPASMARRLPEPEIPERIILAATSLLGIEQAIDTFRNCSEATHKGRYLAWVGYFNTIYELLIGAQTTASLYIRYPEKYDPVFLAENKLLILCWTLGEGTLAGIRTTLLFEGYKIDPLKDLGPGEAFLLDPSSKTS